MSTYEPDDGPGPDVSQPEDEPDIDFENDLVSEVDEDDLAAAVPEGPDAVTDQPAPTEPVAISENVQLDDVLVEFVDLFNARDFEGVSDLLSADPTSQFFQAVTAEELLEGMNDLSLRYPTLTVTRGDLGSEPIAAAWLLDQESDDYGLVGYFRIEVDDSDEPSIVTLEYIEEVPDTEDAVLEPPEGSERNAWEDWSVADSGE